jgi:hypothetical protein
MDYGHVKYLISNVYFICSAKSFVHLIIWKEKLYNNWFWYISAILKFYYTFGALKFHS